MTTLTLTESAKTYLQKWLAMHPGQVFRLSIKKTGCSGYSYLPSMKDVINPTDVKVEVECIEIYLDQAWIDLLDGLQIDYVEEDKNGLKQKRLIFINQKETGRCGCGESFHV